MLKKHNEFFKSLMLLGDVVFLTAAWWVSYFLRFSTAVFSGFDPHVFQHYIVAWVLLVITWATVFMSLDLYRPRRISTHWHEVVEISRASCLALLVFLGVVFLVRELVLSRIVVVMFFAFSVVFLNLSHVGFREGLRFLRRRGYNLRHVAVVGSSFEAKRLMNKLDWHRHLGLRVIGVYVIDSENPGPEFEGRKALTSRHDLLRLVQSGEIDQIFVTLPLRESSKLGEIQSWLGDEPVTLLFVPELGDLAKLHGRVEEFDGLHIMTLQGSPLFGWDSVLKRALDLILGGLALVVFSPVMVFAAAAIKFTSSGPILYRQERMGLDGRRFQMLKFRTMVDNAEELSGPVWATPDDSRVTAIGRLLRRTSLDELPQLINVLKGEMSLVGPRPERPPLIEQFRKSVPKYMLRHKVKAGMTGWAQINGWRGNTSLEKRIEHDVHYIEHWSVWFDLKILALTACRGFLNRT